MKIGCVKEIKRHEYRVGMTPHCVKSYVDHGHQVTIQAGAGADAGFEDAEYAAAGARIESGQEADLRLLRHDRQGQGASARGVRPAPRGADPLHLPPPRRGPRADRRPHRAQDQGSRLRDHPHGRRHPALPEAHERDRRPALGAGGGEVSREALRRTRRPPGRRARRPARQGRHIWAAES